MVSLERFSFGVGDRFARQARAQLAAFQKLATDGVDVVPVWNRSNRAHVFVGSDSQSVYAAAQAAVEALGWTGGWHVDADHVRLDTVDRFIPCCDFFTIDVADAIGRPAAQCDVTAFVARHPELTCTLNLAGASAPFTTTRAEVERVAANYHLAVQEASKIYRHIAATKGDLNFIAEISMDETDAPPTSPELLVILAALADEEIRIQTIAPKFAGRFNKGVDYVCDLGQFEREFNDDLDVIAHAIASYGLPDNLKLSVRSGSDKFSLYPIILRALARIGTGLHLKTAGTTWLEELIGLAEGDGDGLGLTRDIYKHALAHVEEF